MANGVKQIFTYNQEGTNTTAPLPNIKKTHLSLRAYIHPLKQTYIDKNWEFVKSAASGLELSSLLTTSRGLPGHSCILFGFVLMWNTRTGNRHCLEKFYTWKLSLPISPSKAFSNTLPFVSKFQTLHKRAKTSVSADAVDHKTSGSHYSEQRKEYIILQWRCLPSNLMIIWEEL